MSYLGFLCLGAVLGIFFSFALKFANSLDAVKAAMTACIAAAFSGTLFVFIKWIRAGEDKGIFMYPVGMLIALTWWYAAVAVENIKSGQFGLQLLGWAHMFLVTGATLIAGTLALWQARKDL